LEVADWDFAYDPEAPEVKDLGSDELNDRQRDNEPRASNGSSFRLGEMIERGAFNYRWPLTEYYLLEHPRQYQVRRGDTAQPATNPQATKDSLVDPVRKDNKQQRGKTLGICQMFSCAKDGMFYQVLRVEEGGHHDDRDEKDSRCRHFPQPSKIAINIGSPVWFHRLDEYQEHLLREGLGETSNEGQDKVVDVSDAATNTGTLRYWDVNRKVGLEAKVYAVGDDGSSSILPLTPSWAQRDSGSQDQRGDRVKAYTGFYEFPSLGKNTTIHQGHRSVTVIAAIRLFEGDETGGGEWPKLPTSQELFNYIGVSPSSPDATGALWESVFVDRRGQGPMLSLADFSMLGRSLEKILEVDIIPASFAYFGNQRHRNEHIKKDKDDYITNSEYPRYAALVSNIFLHTVVDLNAML
jgi:hypothetical protein